MFDLSRTQLWLQAVIMHPDGIVPGVLGPNAQLQMDVPPTDLETVVTRSKSLTAAERLAIYGRAYHARLTDCLRAEFHVLRHALGEELFDMFARAYLYNCPARSFPLADLGKNFPEYLEATRPDHAPGNEEELWPHFIVDMARLERAFSEVFDGPGTERESLLSAERLRSLSFDRYAQVRLIPVACFRLLLFRYPVHDYFHSVRKGRRPNVPLPTETFLAMNRKDFVVRILDLSASQYQLLSGLIDGETVNDSLKRAGASSLEKQEELVDCRAQWSEQGLFSSAGS